MPQTGNQQSKPHPKQGKPVPKKPKQGWVLLSTIRQALRAEQDAEGRYLLTHSEKTLDRRYEDFLNASSLPLDHHLDKERGCLAIPEPARPIQEAIYIQLDRDKEMNLVNKVLNGQVPDITYQDRKDFEDLVKIRVRQLRPEDTAAQREIIEAYRKSMRLDVYWLISDMMARLHETISMSMELTPESQQRCLSTLMEAVLGLQYDLLIAGHVEKGQNRR